MSFIIKTLPNGTPLPDKGKDFLLMQEADGHIISPPDEFQDELLTRTGNAWRFAIVPIQPTGEFPHEAEREHEPLFLR